MTDDTKDWAPIRIEEPVRDAARDDPRTYTEIMRAGLNTEQIEHTGPELSVSLTDRVDPDDLRDQLDRIESAAEAAEDRTGSIQNALESEGIGR